MDSKKLNFKNIDEYINLFPKDVQDKLRKLRSTIRKAAPNAEEKISYQMPAFVLNGNLVYFAAYKKHIGFYPTSSGIKKFQTELTKYKTTKGAIQFPMDQPLPLKLIAKIVKYRIKENTQTKKNKS
ncbi:DUF1801 domain-containing protein [Leptospira noguchii]|nr:DUF1801 domain-containing protein [Leptospira noguchii]